MELALSVFWLAAVAGLIFRALRQRSALHRVEPTDPPPATQAPAVAVVVPARNEAANIGACLDGLTAQTYPAPRLQIIVVDDQSSDGTGAIIAARAERDGRVRLLASPPLPAGWVGKPHACAVGAEAAAEADWLCFVDADVRLDRRALASALAAAEAGKVQMLSLVPSQDMLSFAERLVMPCGLYLLAFTQDLDEVQGPDSSAATASGQFILVRRDAYEATGGHAAVRGAITEDVALARLMKRTGRSIALLGGDGLLRTRMYTGWSTLWPGVAKNLVEMMGGPASTIAIAIAGVVLAWLAVLVPALDSLAILDAPDRIDFVAFGLALVASASAFGLHIAGAAYFRIPFWYGLLFPLGYTAGAAMALDSVRQRMVGRVGWKGRTYP